ncbi:MAG TPA: hypothetical protein VHQ90_10870 [Thermoanaerobaculia bacterium]|nr:hypothetical protein [Thermoanaerobaculia bacterium]
MSHKGQWPETPARPFFQHQFGQRVEPVFDLPRVLFSRRAYEDMFHLVDLVQGEVGWIGTVERAGRDFLVREIFLPAQEAHAMTCELTAEGLAAWASEIIASREDGLAVANSIRFWGHSHHTMDTRPSRQDEEQMRELAAECGDFFIRAILNKRGRLEITIYLLEEGLVVRDAEWALDEPRDNSRRAYWQAEVAAKIRRKPVMPAKPWRGHLSLWPGHLFPAGDFGFGPAFGLGEEAAAAEEECAPEGGAR